MQIFKSSPADVYLLNGGKLARLTVEIELNFWRWRGSFYSGATSLSMSKRQAAWERGRGQAQSYQRHGVAGRSQNLGLCYVIGRQQGSVSGVASDALMLNGQGHNSTTSLSTFAISVAARRRHEE